MLGPSAESWPHRSGFKPLLRSDFVCVHMGFSFRYIVYVRVLYLARLEHNNDKLKSYMRRLCVCDVCVYIHMCPYHHPNMFNMPMLQIFPHARVLCVHSSSSTRVVVVVVAMSMRDGYLCACVNVPHIIERERRAIYVKCNTQYLNKFTIMTQTAKRTNSEQCDANARADSSTSKWRCARIVRACLARVNAARTHTEVYNRDKFDLVFRLVPPEDFIRSTAHSCRLYVCIYLWCCDLCVFWAYNYYVAFTALFRQNDARINH